MAAAVLVLSRAGDLDEAAGQATNALNSGRIVPSTAWRAAEILSAVEAAGIRDAVDLRYAYTIATTGAGPPE